MVENTRNTHTLLSSLPPFLTVHTPYTPPSTYPIHASLALIVSITDSIPLCTARIPAHAPLIPSSVFCTVHSHQRVTTQPSHSLTPCPYAVRRGFGHECLHLWVRIQKRFALSP
ncbi:hypothetical protein E2C01_026930 [Portunus trituberculatus]|uniref:Uncharacterized protein n=1 Tax=Portunus trituberculatus TaxID=210409 RepID=A0A5B7EJI3_PORTR|nr:hypothetical protein [Portunus trituberculatus]